VLVESLDTLYYFNTKPFLIFMLIFKGGVKMKKIFVIMAFAIAVALLFASCETLPQNPESYAGIILFWDESLPKEESVGLLLSSGMKVTSYNGIPVEWGKNGYTSSLTMVYLPPGTVNFTLDLYYTVGNTIVSMNDAPFEWTFSAGDRYYLYAWWRDDGPAILVINSEDRFSAYDERHAAYKLPRRTGTLNLQ
jgi:hypothetical protein